MATHSQGTILNNTTVPTWSELGVRPEIEKSLAEVGITAPFPIQALAIPLALDGVDLIGQARTGTGKTLAFGLSTLQRILVEGDEDFAELEHPGKPQALIMAPTRELALQVTRDLDVCTTIRTARVLTVYGGVGYDQQLDELKTGVDIVVGTPGRILDLVQRRSLDLSHVKVLVLDEADEMLDLGFLPDVESIISRTPASRQTMLFSATMPSAIMALARTHLTKPVHLRAEGHDAQATVPDTTQFVYQAHDLNKPDMIGLILQAEEVGKVMIFCKTKRSCQRLADELADRGFPAAPIHGDLNQAARERALKKFREGKVTVLVATDVAARGIDVTGVTHVINNECPDDDKTYVHRIGRTGRAGAKGVAITLVDWADVTKWKVINKALDLDFTDPVETYSTSDHFFTDLHIPTGLKPYLTKPEPRAREERDDRGRGGRGGRDGGRGRGGERGRSERPAGGESEGDAPARTERPKRQRRRLRNGKPVEDAAVSSGTGAASGAEQNASADAASTGTASTGTASTDAAPRRRRRRRSGRGGAEGAGSDGAASSAAQES